MLAKYTKAVIGGKEVEFSYTVAAMFEINGVLGEEDLYEILMDMGGKKFGKFCDILGILSKCAANAREAEGSEQKNRVVTSEELKACMSPAEYIACKKAAMDAVLLGYGREIADGEEETDIGLAELEKKRNRPGRTY